MTAILAMLAGAIIGACVALVLYVIGFGVELINCACQIITCDCDGGDAIPGMWSSSSFVSVLLFCAIAGAIIGLVYGIYKMKVKADEEARRRVAVNSEEARKQRVNWASEIKEKSLNVANICAKNKRINKNLISTTYQASNQMTEIINELTRVTEKQGKVDSLAEELSKKGGASL